jgi:solute carrier family 25 carnitine/acylcarnitine transporter 20/29
VYFWVYVIIKHRLLLSLGDAESDNPGEYVSGPAAMAAIGVSGALAGVVGWSVCYPIDTVKSMLMAKTPVPDEWSSIEWLRLLRDTPRERLWRGFSACMARTVPLNAVTFLGYELSLRFLHRDKNTEVA